MNKKHEETNQVKTLRSQFRFIKYGVAADKCHYCDEICYQITLEYIDFEGNVIVKPCHDRVTKSNGHEYTLVKLNHENEKHHEIFQKDIAEYKQRISNKRKALKANV